MIRAHDDNPSRAAYAHEQARCGMSQATIAYGLRRMATRPHNRANAARYIHDAELNEESAIRCANFLIAFATEHGT